MAAHLFIFYYGVTADITPPDALAAYAAAGIAKTDPFKTGFTATRLALAGILVPFVFAYSPIIILQGHVALAGFVETMVTAVIGIIALSGAVSGYFFDTASWPERAILAAAALALVFSDPRGDVVGLGLLVLVSAFQIVRRRMARPHAAAGVGGG
jgi:TRAP-type uncharacterized transport system fused permease subunit